MRGEPSDELKQGGGGSVTYESQVAQRMSRVRLGKSAQKKMKKIVRAHLMVVQGYGLERGIDPEQHEMVFTIEREPRVVIVAKGTGTPVGTISLDEAIDLAMKGLQASMLIGALTGTPVKRSAVSAYAKP
ncbi:MAG: hypothetical protein GX630_09515 [Actinobacteria bacterium]|nr:hypothetical protein [Actinomycetota bacterium]